MDLPPVEHFPVVVVKTSRALELPAKTAQVAAAFDSYQRGGRPTLDSTWSPGKIMAHAGFDGPFDVRVMGLTQSMALAHDGDIQENADACSSKHNQGDWSNQFCHATLGAAITEQAEDLGLSKVSSSLIGAAALGLKELTDKNVTPGDIFITSSFDHGVVEINNTDVQVNSSVTVGGDGAFGISLSLHWWK